MSWTVTNVVDGDTFEVNPGWTWKGQSGKTVRAAGYNTPEQGQPGYGEAKERLTKLILNKEVGLGNGIQVTYERLLCPVSYKGNDLAEYFREYQ
jgi:endonuclease YncB( thermonuclease family)